MIHFFSREFLSCLVSEGFRLVQVAVLWAYLKPSVTLLVKKIYRNNMCIFDLDTSWRFAYFMGSCGFLDFFVYDFI